MNFVDAVRELKEERCEGIKRKISIVTLHEGVLCQHGVPVFVDGESIIAEDWELVNPKPQFEEIEVVRWCWNNGEREIYSEEKPCLPPLDYKLIKLTGKRKVEVKPKVKHREELKELLQAGMYAPKLAPFVYKGRNVQLFAEWEE